MTGSIESERWQAAKGGGAKGMAMMKTADGADQIRQLVSRKAGPSKS